MSPDNHFFFTLFIKIFNKKKIILGLPEMTINIFNSYKNNNKLKNLILVENSLIESNENFLLENKIKLIKAFPETNFTKLLFYSHQTYMYYILIEGDLNKFNISSKKEENKKKLN
jgi:hypothetical protein